MNVFTHFQTVIQAVVSALAIDDKIPSGLDSSQVMCELPRDASHGDLTTNAAMVLARSASLKPRDLAMLIAARLKTLPEVADVAVAGPGFINMRLADDFWRDRLREVLRAGVAYGNATRGKERRVNVEFVSANPTGPLHVGHGRGAVVGDVLAALLEKTGHAVTREYYINDAGAQVDVLARSTHLRYREVLGEEISVIPEGYYPGDYLKPVGQALAYRDGHRWLNKPESEWLEPVRTFAVDAMMALIRSDLKALGVRHDIFLSERRLVADGWVDTAVSFLSEHGLVYEGVLNPPRGKMVEDWEPRPQILFRATRFGDDIDRPLKKSDGRWTYFASDLAYHLDKHRRGFSSLIDVWGADHGGYIKRMVAGVQALTEGRGELDVKLCQMVNLLDDGVPVKMSKRAGTFVTLRDVVDRVGRDAVRFIMLTRKNDAHLDFDFARVTEQSRDNPVFYVQYAHARACSVRRHAQALFPGADLSGQE
ncbi:MAG: arginyl-tRNA synthetase, partial [Rhodospirillaceae bacterium]